MRPGAHSLENHAKSIVVLISQQTRYNYGKQKSGLPTTAILFPSVVHFHLASLIDGYFFGALGKRRGDAFAARPTNPDLRGWLRCAQNLHRAVLRPIPAASMDLSHRTCSLAED